MPKRREPSYETQGNKCHLTRKSWIEEGESVSLPSFRAFHFVLDAVF